MCKSNSVSGVRGCRSAARELMLCAFCASRSRVSAVRRHYFARSLPAVRQGRTRGIAERRRPRYSHHGGVCARITIDSINICVATLQPWRRGLVPGLLADGTSIGGGRWVMISETHVGLRIGEIVLVFWPSSQSFERPRRTPFFCPGWEGSQWAVV